ncbi:hypothetical protein EFX75_10850 [Salmonella enterica]|nr:hypothetical protein [Salmonella enterica]EAW1261503.1 hypothetical protein [Salmonella enterica subsp. diarizonae]EBK4293936.1 hypothetical protein [Salmonella enterica]
MDNVAKNENTIIYAEKRTQLLKGKIFDKTKIVNENQSYKKLTNKKKLHSCSKRSQKMHGESLTIFGKNFHLDHKLRLFILFSYD